MALPWWLLDAASSGKKSQQAKPLTKENLSTGPTPKLHSQSFLGTGPQAEAFQSLRESLIALLALLTEVKGKNRSNVNVLLSSTEDLLPEALHALSQAETMLGNQQVEVCFLPSALFCLNTPYTDDFLFNGNSGNRSGSSELIFQNAASSWVALQTRRSHFILALLNNKAKAFASQEGQTRAHDSLTGSQ